MLSMSKKSDRHERMVADHIDSLSYVRASRPPVGTEYSDVLIDYNSQRAWLEVKMGHTDNLVNPRVYYHENAWKTKYSTPVAGYIVDQLNKSAAALDFVTKLSEYSKIPIQDIYIPTNISEMGATNSVPREVMRGFYKMNGGYILDEKNYDISHLVVSHYTRGKAEPAYYMQAGDDFYMLSDTNPLNLKEDVPHLTGNGKFRVRVSNRSRFYEIQAEIKMQELQSSHYSLLPNTSKINPLCCLQLPYTLL